MHWKVALPVQNLQAALAADRRNIEDNSGDITKMAKEEAHDFDRRRDPYFFLNWFNSMEEYFI